MYHQQDDEGHRFSERASVGLKPPVKICILGGGFGGLYTALYLQRFSDIRQRCQITLIDQNKNFLFTPLLYELITGELKSWEIAPSFPKLLAHTPVRFRQAVVQNVDLHARQVALADGSQISYDYLVLAVGKEATLDTVPGAAEHAYPFRTLEDAKRLREQLRFLESSNRERIRIAIVGGGPSGVELAGKLGDRLGERGMITLIERGDDILKSFTRASRITAYRALAMRNISVQLQTGIHEIAADHLVLSSYGQTTQIPVDLVLWTAGVRPLDWVTQLPCPQNAWGQLRAWSTLQLVDYPDVFALGDLAEIPADKGQTVPATAQAAYQQASCAAKNIRAALHERSLQRFRYLHLGEMLTLGTNAAAVTSFGISLSGPIACLMRRLIYLQRLPTLRHRFNVLTHWVKNWLFKRTPNRKIHRAGVAHPTLAYRQSVVQKYSRRAKP